MTSSAARIVLGAALFAGAACTHARQPAAPTATPPAPGGAACQPAGAACADAAACCSQSCRAATPGGPPGAGGVCTALETFGGALARLPADVKARDLRLTPPPVEELGARAAPDGKAILTVRLGPDARVADRLVVDAGDRPAIFHDDGRDGDARAGDRVFSSRTELAFADLSRREAALAVELARRGVTRVPIFDGRQAIGFREVKETRDTDILKFIPRWLFIDSARTLFVTDPAVIGDHARTGNVCATAAAGFSPMGAWSFGHLMTAMANQSGTGIDPADLTMAWLQQWTSSHALGANVASPRPKVANIISAWHKTAAGKLDLARAPFKLIAIVNRIDLAGNASYGKSGGGEGRLVFQLIEEPGCAVVDFFVIFEYGIPGTETCLGLTDWARDWLALQSNAVGTPAYGAALQVLTDRFTGANAIPLAPNGSALHQLRTNEALLSPSIEQVEWELREFHLTFVASGGALLQEATVAQTPDESYNGGPLSGGAHSADLGTWINDNQTAILAGTYSVPSYLPLNPSQAFLGMASPSLTNPGLTMGDYWVAPGVASNQARHLFSLGTCNGCHGREAHPGLAFVQTGSAFLTGETVDDPVDGTPRQFNDLARRAQVLSQLASAGCLIRLPPPSAPAELPLPAMEFRPTLDAD